MSKYKIPICKADKQMLRYPLGHADKMEFIENYEWHDILRYSGFARGRSAAYFTFKSVNTKRKYYMFMTDMDKSIAKMRFGILDGVFTYVKRGKNYGIKLLDSHLLPLQNHTAGL